MKRHYSSGTEWENKVGYSRAIQVGDIIEIAGTTAITENGEVVGPGDAAKQTRFIIEKAKEALAHYSADLKDVIRTRIFVTDISRWKEVGLVHGEYFRDIKPASTMVEVSKLIHPDLVVEIEFSVRFG